MDTIWWDQLEALPPLFQVPGAFVMSEPWKITRQDGPISAVYIEFQDRYFMREAPVKDFNLAMYIGEITRQFGLEKRYINV